MSVLIISATRKEVEPFLQLHKEVSVLITGVGAFAANYHLLSHLQNNHYDWVIQCGIAGCTNPEDLGKPFLINRERFADMGVWENGDWKSIYDLGLAAPDEKPFVDGWLPNENLSGLNHAFAVRDAITSNIITDHSNWNNMLQMKFGAQIESMEGAVLHYVCGMKNIPFVQIRGVSNLVGERNKSHWKIEEAIRSSNQLLSEIFEKLNGN